MLEIIIGIIVGISLILLIGTIINNNYQLAIIKIEKAEEDIDMYLEKKRDLLERTKPIIEKELKTENFLPEISQNFTLIPNIDENDILKRCYNTLFKTIDDNDKLLKSEALGNIINNLNDNEEDIVGAIRFYNDTVVDYNKLIVSFPSNIVGFFKRYKKKAFYNNEKREMFEILNEK
ncbi:MAG: LemA family protein [Bacilli bacterium]|nr:LemA family protein [Bacilli bacterium]